MCDLTVKYQFKEYDSAYLSLFERERERLVSLLGSVRIEHIGSTAVPGLGGKGVIDMYVLAPLGPLEPYSMRLQAAGYEFRPNAGTVDRLFHKALVLDEDGGQHAFQVHLACEGSADCVRDIAFRDWLRANPADRQRYEEVKRHASLSSEGKPDAYKAAKSDVLTSIFETALAAQQLL